MTSRTLSELSAATFLDHGYSLAKIGWKDPYDTTLLPAYQRLMTYKSDDAIFDSALTTVSFYRDVTTVYYGALSLIGRASSKSYVCSTAKTGGIKGLITGMVSERIAVDPMTKLFLEDIYRFIVLNGRVNGLQHYYIVDRRLRDFRPTNGQGITIGLDKFDTKEYITNPKEPEIVRVLIKYGTRDTMILLRMLMCVAIAYCIENDFDQLDLLMPQITHINSPMVHGARMAEFSGGGTGAANGNAGTGGQPGGGTPGTGGQPGGGTPGAGGQPGGTPGTGGTGTQQPPVINVIIPPVTAPGTQP